MLNIADPISPHEMEQYPPVSSSPTPLQAGTDHDMGSLVDHALSGSQSSAHLGTPGLSCSVSTWMSFLACPSRKIYHMELDCSANQWRLRFDQGSCALEPRRCASSTSRSRRNALLNLECSMTRLRSLLIPLLSSCHEVFGSRCGCKDVVSWKDKHLSSGGFRAGFLRPRL